MHDTDNDRPIFEELYRSGTVLLHQGRAEESLPRLEQAHELDQSHLDAALNLSGAYILAKRFKQAVAVLEPLSQQSPDNLMVWTNLGAAYLGNPVLAQDEDQLRAITAFKKALAINPAAPNVAYNLGLIYRDRKDIEEAQYWFQQAIKANPNDDHARRIYAQLVESGEEDSQD
jgi:tetratricopeptide (TPR) repeat protein